MDQMQHKGKLVGKITTLAQSLGATAADCVNKFSKYKYIGYESLYANLREALPKYKLGILSSVVGYEETPIKTAQDKNGIRSVVTMDFEIVDTETGYSVKESFVGADQDNSGKSMSQAVTECHKRFLLKTFFCSSKGDADPDEQTTENFTPKVRDIPIKENKTQKEDTSWWAKREAPNDPIWQDITDSPKEAIDKALKHMGVKNSAITTLAKAQKFYWEIQQILEKGK